MYLYEKHASRASENYWSYKANGTTHWSGEEKGIKSHKNNWNRSFRKKEEYVLLTELWKDWKWENVQAQRYFEVKIPDSI